MEYQYNEFIYVIDNYDEKGTIELLFTKDIDIDSLTYEDLGITEFYPEDMDILKMFKRGKNKYFVYEDPLINGEEKYARVLIRRKPPLEVLINHLIRAHEDTLDK